MKRYDKYKDSSIAWIGNIPEHWQIRRLGQCFSFSKGLSITKGELQEEGVAVLSYGQIHSKLNTGTAIKQELIRRISPNFLKTHPQSLLKLHDFVFADTSEDLDGAGNCAFNDYEDELFAGYHTIIARPSGLTYPKYIAYLFQSKDWRKSIQSSVNGIKVYSITKSILKQSYIILPPQEEQEAIVAYLEEKTNEMDALVAKKEELIVRLRELKQSTIAKAVTQGLDTTAPLAPSGIPWLGDVPQHWEVKRLGALFTENKTSNTGLLHTNAYKFNYGTLVRKYEDVSLPEVLEIYSKYTVLREKDIVINGLNLNYDFISQRIALALEPGIITSAYLVLSPKAFISQLYYCFLFKAMDSKKLFHGMGTGIRLTLSYKELKSQSLPCPPLAEQEAIVAYIEQKTCEIDRLIECTEQEIARIRELKQSLIADAVTGRFKVPAPNN